jgi:hypothetical protein
MLNHLATYPKFWRHSAVAQRSATDTATRGPLVRAIFSTRFPSEAASDLRLSSGLGSKHELQGVRADVSKGGHARTCVVLASVVPFVYSKFPFLKSFNLVSRYFDFHLRVLWHRDAFGILFNTLFYSIVPERRRRVLVSTIGWRTHYAVEVCSLAPLLGWIWVLIRDPR